MAKNLEHSLPVKRAVVIGGGTGSYATLCALKRFPDIQLTAIVSMADDGGSTGRLRDELGALPPGDVRRCLVALSEETRTLRRLFEFRFKNGALGGHSFGNIFLAALEKMTGDFERAVEVASRILRIRGEVIPVTLSRTRLFAELEDGTIVRGEANIDIPKHDPRVPISRIFLKPLARINPKAGAALAVADAIIIGPGDLFTSVIPNFLVQGMAKAFSSARARKIYVANLMTDYGETDDFRVVDFVETLASYSGSAYPDLVLYNSNARLPKRLLARYAGSHQYPVELGHVPRKLKRVKFVGRNMSSPGTLIRHDFRKLGKVLYEILQNSKARSQASQS